ncbi:hypothetical protein [Streptomyces sp. NRRL S-15]|uniref:hypothetical protein n=1 Tax=Streptomyces sp. NRRL S-15 TaxID=1463886 RepID=UPI000AB103D2|nr:hypothetical protein [Streptomyces sp. NRRL S-15]
MPTAYGPVAVSYTHVAVVAVVDAAGAGPDKAWAEATGAASRSVAERAATAVRLRNLIVMPGTLGG